MAQGTIKKKSSSVAKKGKTQKKSLGPKKGGRVIKPKKVTKTSKTATIIKKKIEVRIKESIEISAVNQAMKQEYKPLTFLKPLAGTAEKKKVKGGKGQKGKRKK